jgi:hypothetical protein
MVRVLRGLGAGVTAAVALATAAAIVSPARAAVAPRKPVIGAIVNVSKACAGQNAEVEQAVDPSRGYVYEVWMGCDGIGFARSADGGRHFGKPITVPGSAGSWDPAIAVAPGGTVYAAYMVTKNTYTYPVVAASFDHGRTFPQVSPLVPKIKKNWGDRDFITVGPDGAVYLTWDYGPSAAAVTFICTPGGSCAFATGDLNVVVQKSTNGGKTWGPIINKKTYTMTPAHTYFTSSRNGGKTWSAPVRIGPARLTMSLAEWWIDGALGIDAAGNLYATWDTQGATTDIGWLAYSTNHGRTWSSLRRVTPDRDNATHIVEVAGGGRGIAYVGWLADSSPQGYAQYLRPFSIAKGWLSGPVRVSTQFGNKSVWPGDTFGISVLTARPGGARNVIVSWGSATGKQPNPLSEIFAAVVRF